MRNAATVGLSLLAVVGSACDGDKAANGLAGLESIANSAVVVSVAAGHDFTCAVTRPGSTFCFGRSANGALGTDTMHSTLLPVLVSGASAAAVSAGEDHACLLSTAGTIDCWGSNASGQLGDGRALNHALPARTALGTFEFRQLSAGARHTCAIGHDQRPYCWGWNAAGQIGNNSTIGQLAPVEVHGELRILSISAGRLHTCAIDLQNGLYCWGNNERGQLGDGSSTSRPGAVPIAPALRFSAVSAGERHTCALTITGRAYCWGEGAAGQLGNNGTAAAAQPAAVAADIEFAAIAAGSEHTCAVARSGELYCWGQNAFGRLGLPGLQTIVPAPVRVESGSLRFHAVSAGHLHTCAIEAAGALYCWGFGGFGQLGNGRVAAQAVPTRVAIPAS